MNESEKKNKFKEHHMNKRTAQIQTYSVVRSVGRSVVHSFHSFERLFTLVSNSFLEECLHFRSDFIAYCCIASCAAITHSHTNTQTRTLSHTITNHPTIYHYCALKCVICFIQFSLFRQNIQFRHHQSSHFSPLVIKINMNIFVWLDSFWFAEGTAVAERSGAERHNQF